jgi:hypothetical protein
MDTAIPPSLGAPSGGSSEQARHELVLPKGQ